MYLKHFLCSQSFRLTCHPRAFSVCSRLSKGIELLKSSLLKFSALTTPALQFYMTALERFGSSSIMDQPLSILSLPNEVLELVIKELSKRDKKELRLTCTRMDGQVMRHFELHPELNDENVEAVLGIQQSFSKLLVSDLTTRRAHFVRGLRKMADSITELAIHHNVTNGNVISLLNCTRIFRICTNVTQLSISGTILNILLIGLDFFGSISTALTQLKTLDLGFGGAGDRGFALSALTFARFRHLESFSVWISSYGQLKLTQVEYSKITEFIAMHWSTLKFIKLDDQGSHLWARFGNPTIPASPEILEFLTKVQLESLVWHNSFLDFGNLVPAWTAVPDLIKEQRVLKKILFDFPVDHLMDSVRMAVNGSCGTLESFTIRFHQRTTIPFDCHILSECHRLKMICVSHPTVAMNMDHLPRSIEDLHWDSPLTPRLVWILQQYMVNLTCLRLGDRSGAPLQDTVQQMFLIPKLKIIRLCSPTNVALRGLINEAARNFDPPADIIHQTRFDIINGIKVIED